MSFSGAVKFFDGNGSKMSNEDGGNSSLYDIKTLVKVLNQFVKIPSFT